MRHCAKESFFMSSKVDQIVSSLQKLYVKRDALNKQIADEQKKLATEVNAVAKQAETAKKAAAKTPAAKPAAKTAAKK
jgi:hypothetical protein